jgi:hypothetical protein
MCYAFGEFYPMSGGRNRDDLEKLRPRAANRIATNLS